MIVENHEQRDSSTPPVAGPPLPSASLAGAVPDAAARRTGQRYLVTGATGLLGNNLVRQLLEAGHEVRVLARAGSDRRPFEDLTLERCEGDVRDAAAVARACEGVDVVIHSAAHVHFGWTQMDVHRAINVEGTRNIAAAARSAAARMVHVSSTNALGLGRIEEPADEETALPGVVECPYVLTKRAAEQVVLDEVHRGLWATIVQPTTMFGPWDWKPSSGKMIVEVSKFSLWAPTGSQNFCDARDVAAGAISAAQNAQAGRRYILGGENLTYRDAWSRMAALAGKRGPRLPMGPVFRAVGVPVCNVTNWLRRDESPANSAAIASARMSHCFTSQRAERELGYRSRPIDETLRDTWAWFRERGYVR
jgi:dihydroflavonol-4-reductase